MANLHGNPPTLVSTPELAKFTVDVMTRLAEEGVPLKAIARITKHPCDHVVEVLTEAVATGTVLQMPRQDWPANVARDQRVPALSPGAVADHDTLMIHTICAFKLTKLEAAMFLGLLKRREVTREQLHKITMQRRPASADETDQKIVDVMICKLRAKLRPILGDDAILTIWSCGYMMPPEIRARALSMIESHMRAQELSFLQPSEPPPVSAAI